MLTESRYGGRANPYAQQDSPAGQYNSPPQASFGQPPRPGGGGYNQYDNGAYDGGYGECCSVQCQEEMAGCTII